MTASDKLSIRFLCRHPSYLLGFGFGSGLSPVAPGTMGTLVAIPLVMVMQLLPLPYYILVTVLAFVIGITICQRTAQFLGKPDPAAVVWDEIVGLMVTMIAVPQGWPWWVMGFVFFRLFDIVKPWPVGWCDRYFHGGFGIMLDDVVAGLMACLCLHGVVWLAVLSQASS